MSDPVPPHLSQIFDGSDYAHIVNSGDEVGAVLRGQQMAEEWLTYWIECKLTRPGLLEGLRLDFPQRVRMARRLDLPEALGSALEKLNDMRNRLAHRKAYRVQESELDALASLIDAVPSQQTYSPVAQMQIVRSGLDASGVRREIAEAYADADVVRKFTLLIAMLSTKMYEWMQRSGVANKP